MLYAGERDVSGAARKEIDDLMMETSDHLRACSCRFCLRLRLGIAVLSTHGEDVCALRQQIDQRPQARGTAA